MFGDLQNIIIILMFERKINSFTRCKSLFTYFNPVKSKVHFRDEKKKKKKKSNNNNKNNNNNNSNNNNNNSNNNSNNNNSWRSNNVCIVITHNLSPLKSLQIAREKIY